jgi:deoxyribodipyrimidine photo-lyase
MGGASRWWLDKSLAGLAESLAQRGAPLILRRGTSIPEIMGVLVECRATAIYFSRAYEPWAQALDLELKAACDSAGIALKRFGGALLREPEVVRTQGGQPFKVYTPFWRALSQGLTPAEMPPAPRVIASPEKLPKSLTLSDLDLHPRRPDWSGVMAKVWRPGEAGAVQRLHGFLKTGLKDYAENRNRPDIEGTSRLSPHLHFGEISPAQCWHAAVNTAAGEGGAGKGLETFLKELVWREFSYTLLMQRPDLPDVPFRPEFAHFPWRHDDRNFKAWTKGQTGFPIVDAGMRELWATGTMHNRIRMISASFLIKDLMIPWQQGETWFWDTLVDADLASNAASWQWVAGSGADAAPYFRIFNPVTQGQKFDPHGAYVRRWVPELKDLPGNFMHAPWEAPAPALALAGVVLGQSYPHRIVDHAVARTRALEAYGQVKNSC